jgi:hypothetical protein
MRLSVLPLHHLEVATSPVTANVIFILLLTRGTASSVKPWLITFITRESTDRQILSHELFILNIIGPEDYFTLV